MEKRREKRGGRIKEKVKEKEISQDINEVCGLVRPGSLTRCPM